jgi:uncharacterized protein
MAIALQLEPKILDRLISKSEIKNIEKLTEEIKDFCDRWQIEEFYLFGSVLRDDFRPDSDIDLLVQFRQNCLWGLLELVRINRELEYIFGRNVDLLTKASIEKSHNWIRRKEILGTMRLFYVKG